MRMSDLLDERQRLKAEAESIISAAENANRLPDSTEQEKLDGLRSKANDLETRIANQAFLDDLDKRAQGETIATGQDNRWQSEVRQFSLTKAIAAQIDPTIDAGREREISQELARRSGKTAEGILAPFEALVPEQRVLTKTGDGSDLIQTDVLENQFIDALRPSSVAVRLGAQTLTGLRGDIALPKLDALTPAAQWVQEDSAITGGDHSFTQVSGTPKHLGVLTEYSRKVALQTTPEIEALVRRDFIAKLGAGVDLGVLKGTGSNGQPTGITQTGGIGTKDSSSSAPSWADIIEIMAQVEAADVPQANLGWALNANTKATLRSTPREIDGSSVAVDSVYLMNDMGTLGGATVATTSQLAGDPGSSPVEDGEAIFGAWNQVIVAFWSGVEILVNPYAATPYSKGNVQVRGMVDADVLVRHPAAFVHWQNILVS